MDDCVLTYGTVNADLLVGGWSSIGGVGTRYGHRFSMEHLRQYMEKISISLELT